MTLANFQKKSNFLPNNIYVLGVYISNLTI